MFCIVVCFSSTGRLLFTSYDDNLVEVWDILDSSNANSSSHVATSVTYTKPSSSLPREHTGSISTVDVNESGQALATASADNSVKVSCFLSDYHYLILTCYLLPCLSSDMGLIIWNKVLFEYSVDLYCYLVYG